jgi:hypothetical protein
MMDEKQEIMQTLYDTFGRDGCGLTCCQPDTKEPDSSDPVYCEPEIYKDETGWKLFMEGFMEPWPLGRTVQEAKAALIAYGHTAYGLG